jgi:ADP-ribose pyrophosphatase
MEPWKRIEPTTAQKVGYRTIVTKTFLAPNGKREFALVNAEGSRNAACIALTPENEVIICRQFRPGPEIVMDELPGGGVEMSEEPEHAALRELREETGYAPGNIRSLGFVYKDGYTNSQWHYFLATDCRLLASGRDLDIGEFIDVHLISVKTLLENIKRSVMTDTEAVLLAYEYLRSLLPSQRH